MKTRRFIIQKLYNFRKREGRESREAPKSVVISWLKFRVFIDLQETLKTQLKFMG